MTKQSIVDIVADKMHSTKKDAGAFLDAFFEAIGETLASGEKVTFTGFGTFEVRERARRKGINPRTRQEIVIPASKYPAFKPGKVLKDTVC